MNNNPYLTTKAKLKETIENFDEIFFNTPEEYLASLINAMDIDIDINFLAQELKAIKE